MRDAVAERRAEVYALLASLNDLYPSPATSTGALVARSAVRGPSPSRRVACGACKGEGRTKRGGAWFNCMSCGGSNERNERGRGWIDVDDYTLEPVGTAATGTSPRRTVRCDVCGGYGRLSAYAREKPPRDARLCPACEGSGVAAVSVTIAPTRDVAGSARHWLDAIDDRRRELGRRGSYAELAAALRWLEQEHERRFRALWRLVVCEPWIERTAYTHAWLDRTVDMLALRLPATINVPAEYRRTPAAPAGRGRWANGAAQASRDMEIRVQLAAGQTAAALAAKYGVRERTIRRIRAAVRA